MKRTRFTNEQMLTILRQANQRPAPEVAKEARDQRPDDLRLAEALRHAGGSRREAAATARAGKRADRSSRQLVALQSMKLGSATKQTHGGRNTAVHIGGEDIDGERKQWRRRHHSRFLTAEDSKHHG
jgi:hypothetical protein